MPLTMRRPKPLDVANMASKLPEPFRKPAAMLGSLASEFLPAPDDVIGQVMPTPLVSMFKNVGIRKMFTDEAVEELKALYPKHLHQQIDELAERVPRTLAHSRIIPDDSLTKRTGAAATTYWDEMSPHGTQGHGARIPVEIDRAQAASSEGVDVAAHELTHVAQRLGNKDAPHVYTLAGKGLEDHPGNMGTNLDAVKMGAYLHNPFEKSARITALRKTRDPFPRFNTEPGIMPSRIGQQPVVKGLENFLQDAMDIMNARRGR